MPTEQFLFFKSILLLGLSLLAEALNDCSLGCLKCTPEGYCLLCDFPSLYAPDPASPGKCSKSKATNCAAINSDGSCAFCGNGFFLINSACVVISKENLIAGCVEYQSLTACRTCDQNSFLSSGKCQPLQQVIPNCAVHTAAGQACAACKNGTLLTPDLKACVTPALAESCLAYTLAGCGECKSGFFLTPRKYQLDIRQLASETQRANLGELARLVALAKSQGRESFESQCIGATVVNCAKLEDFDKCQVCSPGFFLAADKSCQPFPREPVPNCEQYSGFTSCSRCANGFFMAEENQCLAVGQIANCADYDRESDGICAQCAAGFFSRQASCAERVKSKDLANCQLFEPLADACSRCGDGFELNADGTLCLPAVSFCANYTKNATAAACNNCISGYFIDSGVCVKSQAENCLVAGGLASCLTCANGFFLNSTTCSPHPLLALLNCNATFSSGLNQCQSCSPTAVKIPMDGVCRPVAAPTNNCQRYSSAGQCVACNPQTSYPKDDKCPGAYIANCAEYLTSVENGCKTCKVDYNSGVVYVPFPKGAASNACFAGDPNVLNSCLVYQTRDDLEYCATCQGKFYPFVMPSANPFYCVPKDFYRLPSQASLLFDCSAFDGRAGKCVQCANGKVVGSDGVCSLQCKPGEFLYGYSYDESSPADALFKGFMQCSATDPALSEALFFPAPLGCYLVLEAQDESTALCGGCLATQIGALDFAKDPTKTLLLAFGQIANQVSFSYFNRVTPVHGCLPRQTTTSGQTTASETRVASLDASTAANLDNCRLVAKVGASDRFGCVSCRFGFSGQIVPDADGNGYIIKQCLAIPGCNAQLYFNGLGGLAGQLAAGSPPLDFFVACHSCQNLQIPTFARSFSSDLSDATPVISSGLFGAFGMPTISDTLVPYKKTTKDGWMTSCQPAGLGRDFVPNCAVQEVALSRLTQNYSPTSSTNNPQCVACSPGYRATMQAANSRAIKACAKIDNCDVVQSKTFNKCGGCLKGFALKFSASGPDQLSNYEDCVASPNADENCFIANSDTQACVACKPGYLLNADERCDSVAAFGCQTPSVYQKLGKKALKSLGFPLAGCGQCQSSAINFLFDAPKKLCLLSTQLTFGTSLVGSRLFFPNCALYTLDNGGNLVCQACDSGFVIGVSSTRCFKADTRLKNCVVYSDDGASCGRCANGFFLNSLSTCQQGGIAHCLVYSSEGRCATCEEGFLAVQAQGGRALCFARPATNCQLFDPAALASGILSCNLCEYNYYFEKSAAVLGKLPLFLCAEIPRVDNCAAYDNLNDIASARLTCRQCLEGFFLANNTCLARSRPSIASCARLAPDHDACLGCQAGFLVDEQGGCAAFPNGIFGCLLYRNEKLCQQCKLGMFLSENSCLRVPNNTAVANCEVYDASIRCVKCLGNFFLTNVTRCDEAKASNCLTYNSISSCASCPDGFGFVKDNLTTSCVKASVPNCLEPDLSINGPDFKCRVCGISFYLAADKSCVAVSRLINFCALYASDLECSLCFEGYVLSQDRKACLNDQSSLRLYDQNCVNNFVQKSPVCNLCGQGHFFAQNATGEFVCAACDRALSAGCLLCDANNQTRCLACGSGYSQKIDGSCVQTESPPATLVDSGAGLDKVLAGLLIAAGLIF